MECDWCWLLQYGFLAYLGVLLIRFLFADCDLNLQWADKFGKQPGALVRKVVWITGASGGIGEYLAYELAKGGCRLVLSARREEELQRVKKQCLTYGTLVAEDILVLPFDVMNFDVHKRAVDQVLDKFKQIDVLVNNAGRAQRASWEKIDISVDREMMEMNVFSVVSLTRLVLPMMLERKQGHIAVTSSVVGIMSIPCSGSYNGTKHAIQGYFNGLRSEVASHNIKVTLVCPGPIASNLFDECYTETKEFLHGKNAKSVGRMVTSRCARLYAVALANQFYEVWISRHPVLLCMYCNQYVPNLTKWLIGLIGKKFISQPQKGNV